MEIHHSKHHATYVNNLNANLEAAEKAAQDGDASKLISLAPAIKFNGGGHINHTLFWENLCPPSDYAAPAGKLLSEIESAFGSFDAMKSEMSAKTVAVQGSGWGWLGYNTATKKVSGGGGGEGGWKGRQEWAMKLLSKFSFPHSLSLTPFSSPVPLPTQNSPPVGDCDLRQPGPPRGHDRSQAHRRD